MKTVLQVKAEEGILISSLASRLRYSTKTLPPPSQITGISKYDRFCEQRGFN
jgi:hypothetical protein